MAGVVVGYAGLTHLGLCSAIGAATKGFEVVGWSSDARTLAALAQGRLPVAEPGLDEAFARHRGQLAFTDDPAALARCDVVYLAPDVPTDDTGASDLSAIARAFEAVAPRLARAILVVLSQVPPGFSRRLSFPQARLYYQVETLIFGRALERATEPERFIVGCSDPDADLPAPYAAFLGAFGCPVLKMRYESAELAKIAINCFLVASVSTTNTMAELCEAIGADWQEIAPALRLDARIGPKAYLAPGLGIAGGNLERDLASVIAMGKAHGTAAGVIESYIASSRHMKDWSWRTLERAVLAHHRAVRLGVLGLAYKADTHSTKNSPSLALIAQLGAKLEACALAVHDPVVPAAAAPSAVGCAQAAEVAAGADAVLILTPWAEYRRLDPADLARRMRGRVVIDPYGVLDGAACRAAGLDHYVIGRSLSPRA
jgi:UDPglucose 6-dehydrogenase